MSAENATFATRSARRRPGAGKLLLVMGLVVVLLLMALFAAWQRQAANRIQAQLAQLRAAGEPLTSADMEAYYRLPKGREDCTQLYLAACAPFEGTNFHQSAAGLPIVGSNNLTTPPLPGQPWADLQAVEVFLKQYERSLELLHDAARRGGGARYPTNFGHGPGMLLTHVQNLRTAARMLQLEALARAHRGDAQGAAESIRALWRVGESLEYEPLLVSQLVRAAIDGLATGLLEDLLSTIDFSDDDLRMLQAEFRQYDGGMAISRSLRGERAMGVNTFDNNLGADFQPGASPLMRPFINSDKAYYLEQMGRLIEAGDQPMPNSRLQLQQVNDEIAELLQSSAWQRLGKAMTSMLMPSISAAIDANYRASARARTVDAALAAELFRRQQGQFPARLDQLVPEFLPTVPMDPFNGLPLRMLTRGNSLVVYSVGVDLLDNGGVEDNRSDKPDVAFTVTPRSATPAVD